jgi:hypothetical protein
VRKRHSGTRRAPPTRTAPPASLVVRPRPARLRGVRSRASAGRIARWRGRRSDGVRPIEGRYDKSRLDGSFYLPLLDLPHRSPRRARCFALGDGDCLFLGRHRRTRASGEPVSLRSETLTLNRRSGSGNRCRFSLRSASLRLNRASLSLTGSSLRESDSRLRWKASPLCDMSAQVNGTDGPLRFKDARLSVNDARLGLNDALLSVNDLRIEHQDRSLQRQIWAAWRQRRVQPREASRL